jgi:hypothetical protein
MGTFRKWLTGLGALALISVGAAIAQVPATFSLTGSEIVRAALPGGGTDIAVPVYVLRNAQNHTLVATGTTVTTQVPATSGIVLATGAITTWNVNLPTAPYAGQTVVINCPGGTVTTLAIAATLPAGVAIVGTNPTSCTSGGTIAQGAAFNYSVTANTWYRFL